MSAGKDKQEIRRIRSTQRMAREARRRIKQMAAHIPGARSLLRLPEGEPERADRIVVISDIHLGDPHDILTTPESVEVLTDSILELGPVDDLVLLGDLFDFWQSPFHMALERGRELMRALFTMPNLGRLIYLPGNHDHHIFRMFYEEEYSRRLRSGEIDPPEHAIPLTRECPAMEPLKPQGATVPLYMTYPMYHVSVRGKLVLLTHGHLLGIFERSLWNPKHSRLSSWILSRTDSLELDDMERFISPYYEMAALSTYIPGVVEGRYRVYRMLNRTARMWGVNAEDRSSLHRGTLIEENAVEIEALLDHFCPDKPDYFVYGHTHKAGQLVLPLSGTIAINTGCWLEERGFAETRKTILEISDRARLLVVDA